MFQSLTHAPIQEFPEPNNSVVGFGEHQHEGCVDGKLPIRGLVAAQNNFLATPVGFVFKHSCIVFYGGLALMSYSGEWFHFCVVSFLARNTLFSPQGSLQWWGFYFLCAMSHQSLWVTGWMSPATRWCWTKTLTWAQVPVWLHILLPWALYDSSLFNDWQWQSPPLKK